MTSRTAPRFAGGELGPTQACLYETHQASDWGDLAFLNKKMGKFLTLKKTYPKKI